MGLLQLISAHSPLEVCELLSLVCLMVSYAANMLNSRTKGEQVTKHFGVLGRPERQHYSRRNYV